MIPKRFKDIESADGVAIIANHAGEKATDVM